MFIEYIKPEDVKWNDKQNIRKGKYMWYEKKKCKIFETFARFKTAEISNNIQIDFIVQSQYSLHNQKLMWTV
jgi:hypothetical protein